MRYKTEIAYIEAAPHLLVTQCVFLIQGYPFRKKGHLGTAKFNELPNTTHSNITKNAFQKKETHKKKHST